MSSSGRGGRRRYFNKNRETPENWQSDGKKQAEKPRFDKNKGVLYERPKWSAPSVSSEPLPSHDCLLCGKPIKDLSTAITDKNSGQPVHFDCIIDSISERETLDDGDIVAYLGGGRFGIVHYHNPSDRKSFQIKKIFEWEDQSTRAAWRKNLADRFSTT